MSTAPRYSRLSPADRREQILAVARDLFADRPYASVSTAQIADAAGVRRGLLNHYFGTKRALYLEVVRDMVRVPSPPVPEQDAGRTLAEVWDEVLGGWLTMVERNAGLWLAAMRDPDLDEILDAARDGSIRNILKIAGAPATNRNLALGRMFSATAETATVEWLGRGRLDRAAVHDLLSRALFVLVRELKETP